MAEVSPPFFTQGGSYDARSDRLSSTAWLADEGTIWPADLAVSQRGAGANMSVDVSSGFCYVSSDVTLQAWYLCLNDAVVNKTIAAVGSAGQSRKDLVVARCYDTQHGDGSNSWALEVIPGTAATTGTETAPATPTRALRLATVSVAYGQSSVTNANIVDQRLAAVPVAPVEWELFTNPNTTLTTANQTLDVVTKTLQVPMGCRLRLEAECYVEWPTSGAQRCDVYFVVDGNQVGAPPAIRRVPQISGGDTYQESIYHRASADVAAGSHTVKVVAKRSTGSPNITIGSTSMWISPARYAAGR